MTLRGVTESSSNEILFLANGNKYDIPAGDELSGNHTANGRPKRANKRPPIKAKLKGDADNADPNRAQAEKSVRCCLCSHHLLRKDNVKRCCEKRFLLHALNWESCFLFLHF